VDTREAPIVAEAIEDDCEFCSQSGRFEWFNTPLAIDKDYAIAVPSVGSFVPGYILVVPAVHVTASCRIPADHKARLASFTNDLASQLASKYREKITIFEHGACDSRLQPQSACVNHAHLHLVPGSYDLISEAPEQVHKYSSLEEFLEEEREEPYLMLQDPGGPLLSFADQPVPQFFRRVVARRLGMADFWDYAAFPFYENIKHTYRDFGIRM
jgi:diadenosine tetraphosphate (Ap4A) HIT family hydrolase